MYGDFALDGRSWPSSLDPMQMLIQSFLKNVRVHFVFKNLASVAVFNVKPLNLDVY